MKAFIMACAALVVLSVGADLILDQIGFSSAEKNAGANVRLGDS